MKVLVLSWEKSIKIVLFLILRFFDKKSPSNSWSYKISIKMGKIFLIFSRGTTDKFLEGYVRL